MNIATIKKSLMMLFICLTGGAFLHGQPIPVFQKDKVQYLADRLVMNLDKNSEFHPSHRPITRDVIKQLLLRADTLQGLTNRDLEDIQYLVDENMEGETFNCIKKDSSIYQNFEPHWNHSPILNTFYKTPANALQADREDVYLRLNPVFDFNFGKGDGAGISTTFRNIRGVEIRGGIGNKVWFYSNLHEVQEGLPAYANEWVGRMGSVPGAIFTKRYNPSFLNNVTGWDYLRSQGVIGLRVIPQISLQLGHGRNFIGNGYRSLFLSDFAADYFYLKLNTKVWIFDYQNIFAELNAVGQKSGDKLIPKRYFATHHLSLNITDHINVGLFESVVFKRPSHFELQYLNPVIFYRTVEQIVGSPDNAMLGADMTIRLNRSIRLYGQFLLDELIIKNFLKQNGWWGNKYGIQAGMQYFNVAGVDHLDMRFEFNLVRPYTYSDSDSSANYSHNYQPLAHPLGANFYETILQLTYNPTSRFECNPYVIYEVTGEDYNGINSGSNILKLNTSRTSEYGVNLPNGYRADILLAGIDMSYSIYHNLFADFSFLYRKKISELSEHNTREILASFGLRMNISKRKLLF